MWYPNLSLLLVMLVSYHSDCAVSKPFKVSLCGQPDDPYWPSPVVHPVIDSTTGIDPLRTNPPNWRCYVNYRHRQSDSQTRGTRKLRKGHARGKMPCVLSEIVCPFEISQCINQNSHCRGST